MLFSNVKAELPQDQEIGVCDPLVKPLDHAGGLEGMFQNGSGDLFTRGGEKTLHWSVPWSDLMMTMFVLFAVLFTYHASEKDVLVSQPEAYYADFNFQDRDLSLSTEPILTENLTQFFEMSRDRIRKEKLQEIASVELVDDKAVKIILPSDVLFDTGQAELRLSAIGSLRSVGEIIQNTPHAITVTGHTDNVPIHTGRFPSNWELSTARACVTARFLINNLNIPSDRIQVVGYAEHRPVRSNDTPSGRAANRRVEIIITKGQVAGRPGSP